MPAMVPAALKPDLRPLAVTATTICEDDGGPLDVRLEILRAGEGEMEVRVPTTAGFRYHLQGSEDLAHWEEVGTRVGDGCHVGDASCCPGGAEIPEGGDRTGGAVNPCGRHGGRLPGSDCHAVGSPNPAQQPGPPAIGAERVPDRIGNQPAPGVTDDGTAAGVDGAMQLSEDAPGVSKPGADVRVEVRRDRDHQGRTHRGDPGRPGPQPGDPGGRDNVHRGRSGREHHRSGTAY